ncbi:MAG: N-acetylmuramoyl-L-alanine amidase [Clostridiales bacterium]|jgi:N-acetylmuramoyl-L-alanine amidase|nr:N-acetylmuramoyl-L-alanine amidase [Clostridiales bacterium]MDR2712470.1 N-acetylmuramoyl-L-alanine amidase [Clostridiales bacterium]
MKKYLLPLLIITVIFLIAPTAWAADQLRIDTDSINIRSGPGTDYAKVDSAGRGQVFTILAEENGWYKISLPGGKSGWVIATYVVVLGETAAYVSGSKQGIVNDDKINIRNQASFSGKILTTVSKNDRLTIHQREGDWYQISGAGGLSGWIYAEYVTLLNVDSSAYDPPGSSLPIWQESEKSQGNITLSFQETNSVSSLTLKGDTFINYRLEEENSRRKLILITDMKISGQLPALSQGQALINGPCNNRLEIISSNPIYYEIKESPDGRQLVLSLSPSSLLGKLVYLDPGHGRLNENGYTDGGAPGAGGLQEKDVVLDIAFKAKAALEKLGAEVRMTRVSDGMPLTLSERAFMANSARADLFISIHCNSATSKSAKGLSTWFYAPAGDQKFDRTARLALSQCLQNAILSATGLANYGIREDRFVVLRETAMPSALIETAFISNREEEALLATPEFRQKVADGIAEGIRQYFIQQ